MLRRRHTAGGFAGGDRADLSVVIPVRNEEECIGAVPDELKATLIHGIRSFEIMVVDDHSTDKTREEVCPRTTGGRKGGLCRYIGLAPVTAGMGKDAALVHGIRSTKGRIVVTMDGDGQNDPGDIHNLLLELPNCGMVCGMRTPRCATPARAFVSQVANTLRNAFVGDRTTDAGCGLRVMTRACATSIIDLHESVREGMHCYYPHIARTLGFRVHDVGVRDRPRLGGRTNFDLFFRRALCGVACMVVLFRVLPRQP